MELLLFYKIDKSNHDALLANSHLFPLSFQKRLRQFRRWQDCQLSLTGRILLSIGLKEIGLANSQWQDIRYTDYGKPYLDEQLHFNITHSGEFAACMVSTERVVGIDLEIHRPIDISEFQNVFSEPELDMLEKTSNKIACFFDYWTSKEAVVKAIGSGLNVSLPALDVTGGTDCQFDGKRWHLDQSYRLPGYSFSVAADKPASLSTPVRHVTFQEALDSMAAKR